MRGDRKRATALLGSAAIAIAILAAPGGSEAKPRPGHWLRHVKITQYWPVPESWFNGKRVPAPGIPGRHRVDWLYSASGLCMEGDGYGLDGHRYHLDSPGPQGWVDIHGHRTENWAARPPYWRAVGWRNKHGGVTYPLAGGGWSNGRARRYRPPTGISFARGPSRHLRFWYSIATDPGTIPKGRWVYIRAYRHSPARGWFRAQDTGGAIDGHHIDVYRPPPRHPSAGRTIAGRTVWVAPRASGRSGAPARAAEAASGRAEAALARNKIRRRKKPDGRRGGRVAQVPTSEVDHLSL